jgi:hypothetical protein
MLLFAWPPGDLLMVLMIFEYATVHHPEFIAKYLEREKNTF